jgi:hypothetical protein
MAGRHKLVVGLAAGLVGFVGAAGASAGTAPRIIALRISFTGSGQLWLTGALLSGPYTCTSTSSACAATFHIPRGRRIVLHEQPANGWHLTHGWSAACYGSHSRMRSQLPEQSCGLRLTARRSVQLTFVPPYPGSFLNPWPLGTTMSQGLYFSPFELTVNSATLNATAEVEAVTDPSTGAPVNGPPPAGDQYTLVNLTLTNKEFTFTSNLPDFLDNVWAEGANNALYKPDTCVPPPLDLGSIGTVDTGQTETGNLCFTIASADVSVLLLRGWYEPPKPPGLFADWFALH